MCRFFLFLFFPIAFIQIQIHYLSVHHNGPLRCSTEAKREGLFEQVTRALSSEFATLEDVLVLQNCLAHVTAAAANAAAAAADVNAAAADVNAAAANSVFVWCDILWCFFIFNTI